MQSRMSIGSLFFEQFPIAFESQFNASRRHTMLCMILEKAGHIVARSIRDNPNAWKPAAQRLPSDLLQALAIKKYPEIDDLQLLTSSVFSLLYKHLTGLMELFFEREYRTALIMTTEEARETMLVHALCFVPDFQSDELGLLARWDTSGPFSLNTRRLVCESLENANPHGWTREDWDRIVSEAIATLDSHEPRWRCDQSNLAPSCSEVESCLDQHSAKAESPNVQTTEQPAQSRMDWETAQKKAEAVIKITGWPSPNGKPSKRAMARKVGCSPSTIRKAMEESPKLRRAFANPQTDKQSPQGVNPKLAKLVAEQELDDKNRHI